MNSELQELFLKREEKRLEAVRFIDEHADKDGTLSGEDAQVAERLTEEYEEMTRQIEKLIERPQTRAIRPQIENYSEFTWSGQAKPRRASAEYRNAFKTALKTNFRQVNNSILETGSPPNGGYLVPTEFDSQIVTTLEEENIMRQICRVITTASEHRINFVASKPAASWLGEGDTIDFANETFGQVILDARKLAVAVKVSNELLSDSFYDLEGHLAQEFGNAIARAEEDAFINGDGQNNKPLGLLSALSASASSFITTAGASISADDIINLEYSLKRPYRRKAAWLMGDATLAQIRKFKDSTQGYLFQPSFSSEEPNRLLGYPIYTTPFMPTTASGNVAVLFGDFSYFAIGERGVRTLNPLRELFALSDQTAFLMIERVDCALTNHEAIRGLKIK